MAKRFLDQIRSAVDSSGMSRYAICKACGIDQAVMSKFMAGKVGMTAQNLERLADFLRLEVRVREVRKGK